MKNYITVDGGTTNTRVYLVCDGEIVDSKKIGIGSKNSTSRSVLIPALRDAIAEILAARGICESEVTAIIASGTITSELGLYTVDHTTAPAGIAELQAASKRVSLPEICAIPFFFISGVKTRGELDECDMMRGEETELMGLIEGGVESMYVLPGSHSKLVSVSADGRIKSLKTMLTGEMIASISSGTILANCVDLSISEFDFEALEVGYEYADRHGLNEALFKTRVLKNIFAKDAVYTYSFFIGVLLKDEIKAILKECAERVIIGGKAQIKRATAHLLSKLSDKEIAVLDDETVDACVVRGAIKIYEYCGKCK